jgi:hypothetical protein
MRRKGLRLALTALVGLLITGCLIPVPVPGWGHHHHHWHGGR